MNRRDALRTIGAGFGTLGLIDVLQANAGPLAPKAPHFPAKAKRVIFLFLNGGMSHIDTFDPKPMLIKHDGQPLPGPKIQTDRASGNLMRSPFEFRKHGQSGTEVSESGRLASRIRERSAIRGVKRCGLRAFQAGSESPPALVWKGARAGGHASAGSKGGDPLRTSFHVVT